jgi:hypothetical protein
MIAIRTRRSMNAIAIVVGCFLAVVGVFALVGPAERTLVQAYVYWLWALPAGLAIWFLAETAGTWLLSRSFLTRMSSPARVAVVSLGVVVIVVLGVAAVHVGGAYAL